jgi:hypothetical protein
MKKIFIIGSIKQAEEIKDIANKIVGDFDISYIVPLTIPKSTQIKESFDIIDVSDIIIAVRKSDLSYGDTTLCQM